MKMVTELLRMKNCTVRYVGTGTYLKKLFKEFNSYVTTWWSPQDEAGNVLGLYERPHLGAGTHRVLLAQVRVQILGPHSLS